VKERIWFVDEHVAARTHEVMYGHLSVSDVIVTAQKRTIIVKIFIGSSMVNCSSHEHELDAA
jgi:hypothetical protein